MKLTRLNARGFSHDLIMVAFVAVFAIGGVAYLVASHADSCSTEASGPISGQPCDPTSGPVTADAAGECEIHGVPAHLDAGQVINPYVTVKNTGTKEFTPNITYRFQTFGATVNGNVEPGVGYSGSDSAEGPIAPGGTVNFNLRQYTGEYASNKGTEIGYTVNSDNPAFHCLSDMAKLPTPTSSTPPPTRLAGSCEIHGVPAKLNPGQILRPYVTVKNTGSQAFTPSVTYRFQTFGAVTNGNVGPGYGVAGSDDSEVSIAPGKTVDFNLRGYTAQYASNKGTEIGYTVDSKNPAFHCVSELADLPKQTSAAGTSSSTTSSSSSGSATGSGAAAAGSTTSQNTRTTAANGSTSSGTTNSASSGSTNSAGGGATNRTVNRPVQHQSFFHRVFGWLGF
jgi:hypothetical protein